MRRALVALLAALPAALAQETRPLHGRLSPRHRRARRDTALMPAAPEADRTAPRTLHGRLSPRHRAARRTVGFGDLERRENKENCGSDGFYYSNRLPCCREFLGDKTELKFDLKLHEGDMVSFDKAAENALEATFRNALCKMAPCSVTFALHRTGVTVIVVWELAAAPLDLTERADALRDLAPNALSERFPLAVAKNPPIAITGISSGDVCGKYTYSKRVSNKVDCNYYFYRDKKGVYRPCRNPDDKDATGVLAHSCKTGAWSSRMCD